MFSILSALTGTPAETATTPRPRPRPKPQPQPDSSDITDTIGNFFTNLLSDYNGAGATVEYQRRRKRSVAERRIRFEEPEEEEDENFDFSQQADEDYNDEEDTEDTQKNVEFVYEPENNNDDDDYGESVSATEARVVHWSSPKGKRIKFFPETDSQAEASEQTKEDIIEIVQKFNEFNKGRKLKFPSAAAERQYIDVTKKHLRDAKQLNNGIKENRQLNYGHQYTNYEQENYENVRDSKKLRYYNDAKDESSHETPELTMAETSHSSSKIKFPGREGKILNRPSYAASFTYNRQQQQQFTDNRRPQDFEETSEEDSNIYNNNVDSSNVVKGFRELSNDYNQYNPPKRPENYYGFNQPTGASIYNSHLTTVNSISNYLSNSATSHNYYRPLSQPLRDSTNSNLFLPTPAPDDEGEENDSLYPNNNFQASDPNQFKKYENNKSQRYTSSSSSSSLSNNSNNRQMYNSNRQSYNTIRRPVSSSSSSSSQSNSSFNSGNSNRYSSNSYNDATNNRYHSSLYTSRRTTTTTPKPTNNNIYVTNSRGETEYYIRPDGRKVYL